MMPWPMTYCVWYGLLLVAQNYIWCAEKAKLATVPIGHGLGGEHRDQHGADSGVGTVGGRGFDDDCDGTGARRCCT